MVWGQRANDHMISLVVHRSTSGGGVSVYKLELDRIILVCLSSYKKVCRWRFGDNVGGSVIICYSTN